jgi:acyl carrier protein
MTREEIIKITNEFLVEEIEVDAEKISDDARLKEDLGIDSLDFVDIVVIVESHFGFKIKPEDMKEVHSLSQFYDFIANKIQ